MENQPKPYKSRRKNSQPVKSPADPSPQPPQDSGAEQSTFVTPATSAVPSMNAAETEKIMRDFLATLKPEEKASDVFAKMAEALRMQEEASLLNSLKIPPRPSTLRETTTALELSTAAQSQATKSLPTIAREDNAPSTSAPVADPPHAEDFEYTVEEVMEAAERVGKGSEAGTSTEENVAEEVVGDGTEIAKEDVVVMGKNSDDLVGTDLKVNVEEGAGDKSDVTVDTKGETLKKCAEGETPVIVVEGETPVIDDEEETPVETEEPDSGGLQTIVDLVNEPESEETPVDERLIRRRTRQRGVLDEVDKPARPRKLDFGGRRAGAGGDVPETTEAEERRLAAERKRKGKHEEQILPKKPKKTPATELTGKLMSDATKVPFAKELGDPATDSEMEDDESEREEEANYERT